MFAVTFFQKKLISWYRLHKRDLPWRRTSSPYHIWISEILLQQTKVRTVIPYYLQFIKRFPTVVRLASADLQDLLKCCEGIGYYSRIRNMHKAAKKITNEFRGKFPDNYSDLLKLPGIGYYTAAAISSIAYNHPIPAMDGNLLRILTRIYAVQEDITIPGVRKRIQSFAAGIIPSSSSGEFNQALMDLGALICLPVHPKCEQCPVSGFCAAKKADLQFKLPLRKKKKSIPHYQIGTALIWKEGKLLITRRKEQGLLGGLWEFPGGKKERGESIEECICREIKEEVNVSIKVKEFFMQVKHAYSHFRITLHVYHCQWLKGVPCCMSCIDWRWVKVDQLNLFPFPQANKKIIKKLLELYF
jgi:A/G-specific adenine glycosylase